LTPDNYIRQVGNDFANSNLNFRNMVFHSRVTDFSRDETDSGLSIKLVLEGCETYTLDNTPHHIRPGNFLVVNEHQQFKCRVRSSQVVEGLCIYLDPALVKEVCAEAQYGYSGMLEGRESENGGEMNFVEKVYGLGENNLGKFLGDMSLQLRDPRARRHIDYGKFFRKLAENMVSSQREVSQLLGNLEMERPATRREVFRRVSVARNYIDEHYLEDISLDLLAEMAFLSKYHFLRCFKQVYAQSPYQYVLYRRLEKGKELLRKSSHSLSEIAWLSGFTDRRAFNKAFRKAVGVSPAAYREQI
jgi:AraC-like DNA-binding protein